MSIIESYQKEINKYRIMSEVCIKLLEFKNDRDTEFNRTRIRRLKDEIINHSNYNRMNSINRTIDKANNIHKSLDNDLRSMGLDIDDEEYRSSIAKLKSLGPKKYLKECIEEIVKYDKLIKEERKAQKNHSKNHNRSRKYKAIRPVTINNISIRKPETLDEIIKKHIREHNTFIEGREIDDIKDQFGLSYYNDKHGYLSDDTIEKLFSLRIVTDLLDSHEEVGVVALTNTMDSLFDLALTEMNYRKKNSPYGTKGVLNYESILNSIKETNRDYVEEYTSLYEKVQDYYNKLSKEEKLELNDRIKLTHNIQDKGNLLMPEAFRLKLNEVAKTRINNWDQYTKMEVNKAVKEISHYTKYMKANELADYYRSLISENKDYDSKKLQEIFVYLIEDRMKLVDGNLSKEDQESEKRKRLKATCRDYLNEEPMFMNSNDVVVESNYATKRIESREVIQQSEKKYFRMSKFRQAIEFMNYSKLQRLNNKEVLRDDEIQRVKGMF